MGRALYRNYRPKRLSEIVGQEHVTTALGNALKNSNLSHAYLFTGPRGTGKTSIARILAHEVNNLPYDEDTTHLDIIEIDAASNRRIDEIRTLRERVHNAPTSAKYKVYIIDEVHMLTKEAFNALLKTLEEPPAHVIFILATTEAHKLPETIISRTQRYTFKPASQDKAAELLKSIATKEKMDISDEALQLVAEHGNGSFRDSVSLLDQVGNSGQKIELADVQRSLGIAPAEAIQDLVNILQSGRMPELLAALQSLREQGYQAPQLAKQLSQNLRTKLLEDLSVLPGLPVGKTGGSDRQAGGPLALDATGIMHKLLAVPAAHDPTALLEIILLNTVIAREPRAQNPEPGEPEPPQPVKASKPTAEPPEAAEPIEVPQDPKADPSSEALAKEEAPQKPAPSAAATEALLDETIWNQALQTIKQRHNTLYGVARMAVPLFNGSELTLALTFPFHQKRLNEAKNKQIISDIIADISGVTVTIKCIVDTSGKKPASKPEPKPDVPPPTSNSHLDTISNIFGGGEVLE